MGLSVAQVLGICVFAYVLRRLFARTSLSNVPGPSRSSWWAGNFYQIFNAHAWKYHHDLIEKYGSVVRVPMVLGDEQLFIIDPLALHHITVKDQYIYEETDMFISSNKLTFGVSLLSTLGDHHRKQRKMLNPVFSLKHMREITPIFYPIAYQLREVLARQVRSGTKEIDVLKWLSRTALEFIGQGGLGYSFDALDEKKQNTFSEAIRRFGPLNFSLLLPRQLLPWIENIGSPEFRRKVLDCIPWERARALCEIVDTMDNQSKDIFYKKKQALQDGDDVVVQQIGKGKDIMSILLRANLEANDEDRLPEKELIGQMSTFIAAGQNTTAHAVSRILHQLVLNPDMQSKLREEATAARKEHGDLDYDTLMGLPYLDAVCRETLRVFPPLTMLSRTTRKDVVLPLMWPIKSTDGKSEIKEIALQKNTSVIMSILGANRSKRIWGEDAEEWKPERWLKPLPESVAAAHLPGVYSSLMTFHGGGRACIGFKFAEMGMKVMVSLLLETFEFSAGPEIIWTMSGLAAPAVKGSDKSASQLPLVLSFVKN